MKSQILSFYNFMSNNKITKNYETREIKQKIFKAAENQEEIIKIKKKMFKPISGDVTC